MLTESFGRWPAFVSGYFEYRKASYVLLHRAALTEGLLEYLKEPRTIFDIVAKLEYVPDRCRTLEGILKAPETLGVVERESSVYSADRFKAVLARPTNSIAINVQLLKEVVGEEKAEAIVYAQNLPEAFAYLRGERDENTFDKERMAQWYNLLEFPYWDFGRKIAAEIIASPGAKILDLASGLGHGLRVLSSIVGPTGRVIGVEKSKDFVASSKRGLPEWCEVIQADLNNGIGFIPDRSIDGGMMIGAFHFIRDKASFLREIRRVLVTGGRFVLGNVVKPMLLTKQPMILHVQCFYRQLLKRLLKKFVQLSLKAG